MDLISIWAAQATSHPGIGGKAMHLARLGRAGVPVPDGWVVPTESFHAHLARHGMESIALDVARDPTDERCSKLREGIIAGAVDDQWADALSVLPKGAMAVRSSASVEDMASASYSGLFRTVLGVTQIEEILHAIKEVWASTFSPEVMAYHNRTGRAETYPAMAVLIMPMVEAEVAGVAFSADPTNGDPFVIAASACRGLATSVVDGREDCDQYKMDWDSLAIVVSVPGTQTSGEFVTQEGRCITRPIAYDNEHNLALDESCLLQLGQLVKEIDRLLETRVDVEFAVAGGEVVILQARPLVGLPAHFPGNPEETDPRVHRSAESDIGPLCPFVRARVQESSSSTIPSPPWPLEVGGLIVHHGRLFYRESPEPEYEERPEAPWEDRTFLRRMWKLCDPRDDFSEWRTWTDIAYAEVIPSLRQRSEDILRLSRSQLGDLSRERLVDMLAEAMAVEGDAGEFYISASGPTYESLRRIEILAKDWLTNGDYREATQIALTMMQGTRKLTHSLGLDIESAANGELTLEEVTCRWGYSYLDLQDMMDLSRWRSWREDITPLKTAVHLMRRDESRGSLEARFYSAAQESERHQQDAIAILRGSDAHDGERRVRIFEACVEACRRCFPLKDDRDLVWSHAQSALRWLLLEAGRRLHRAGGLDAEEEIFLLEGEEILDHLSRPGGAADQLATLIRERALDQERLARYSLPSVQEPQEDIALEEGEILQAEPASPGRAEGPARVVADVADVQDLQPGEVLCLKGEKRVGWTVFFPIIGGFVYEMGNWLCHESNLCRELGIPAVVSLGKKIDLLKPGEMLRIDGKKGIVVRVDRGG